MFNDHALLSQTPTSNIVETIEGYMIGALSNDNNPVIDTNQTLAQCGPKRPGRKNNGLQRRYG